MRAHQILRRSLAVLAALVGQAAWAGTVTGLTTFTAGTPAKAAEVNGNFAAVKTAVDNNDSRIAALEASVAALQASVTTLQGNLATAQTNIATLQSNLATAQSTIATLQSQVGTINDSSVMTLARYLTVTATGTPTALFTGINLQIVNGAGATATFNGAGNVIIGYDEVRNDTTYYCSNGLYTSQSTCQANSGTWAVSLKGGSHYLVVGDQNNYSSYGGVVVGTRNTSNNTYASVSGGSLNTASGYGASVGGGYGGTASGFGASVSGGAGGNTASGSGASVSGGAGNTASGVDASVSGGVGNTASGLLASVSGGHSNTASGHYASVSGGGDGSPTGGNAAAANFSSILGGVNQTTTSASQTIPVLP